MSTSTIENYKNLEGVTDVWRERIMNSRTIRMREDFWADVTWGRSLPGCAVLNMRSQGMQRPLSLRIGNVLPFRANRKAIRYGNRDFLLDTSHVENGTGIARLLEVLPDGRTAMVSCSYCRDSAQGWFFGDYSHPIPMPTPEEAAREFIKMAICSGR